MAVKSLSHNSEAALIKTEQPILGTVLSVQANFYWVRLDSTTENYCLSIDKATTSSNQHVPQQLLCTRRSRLKKMGQQVWVGDRVRIAEPDWNSQRGAIIEVFPRTSELDRPPVANADHILLVFAMANPPLEPLQLSRFLVKAESTQLAVTLCLNKRDLVPQDEQQEWCNRLQKWGYSPILVSLHHRLGLDALTNHLKGHHTIISGPSGVGKSSLINYLIPSVDQRVNSVSGKLGRGRHTTRHVELFELPEGGLVADTPGFNQPELDCYPNQLSQYFPEIHQQLAQHTCQFSNCLHRDEPNCAVRGDWERYEHYLSMLDDAISYQTEQDQRTAKETAMKIKSGQKGHDRVEPKLRTKRYRRKSRRSETQNLQDFCGNVQEMLSYEADD
ncbi:MAG: small ribosomal subunit biogenesis GTPase RsgA [Cyanobacteria bacterium P01_F01_bin.150]